uniref:Uncharacterized protein n=1 Tax=Strongyloides venezuelensis TaxID=75913 RepID=A0A0K0G5K1_STRVS
MDLPVLTENCGESLKKKNTPAQRASSDERSEAAACKIFKAFIKLRSSDFYLNGINSSKYALQSNHN